MVLVSGVNAQLHLVFWVGQTLEERRSWTRSRLLLLKHSEAKHSCSTCLSQLHLAHCSLGPFLLACSTFYSLMLGKIVRKACFSAA